MLWSARWQLDLGKFLAEKLKTKNERHMTFTLGAPLSDSQDLFGTLTS